MHYEYLILSATPIIFLWIITFLTLELEHRRDRDTPQATARKPARETAPTPEAPDPPPIQATAPTQGRPAPIQGQAGTQTQARPF